MNAHRSSRRGFTLIEVLVAVAILGIGITAIFSSQWVSFASIKHARYVNESTGLARCKMSEIEWDLQQNGFQATDVSDSGPCCDGADASEMKCSWSVATLQFPEPKFGQLDLDTSLDVGAGPSFLGGATGPSVGAGPGASALGFLKTGATSMEKGGDVSGIADQFLGGSEGAKDGVAGLVMQVVYPDLKAIFEAGSRKITVHVSWFEGRKEYSTDLEQWVTSSKDAGLGANMGGLDQAADDEDDASTGTTGTGSKGSKSSGAKTTPTSKISPMGGH